MSYLSGPRLVFAGRFQADPSTVNNDPEHFNTATFQPNYQQPGPGATNGWWNPGGTGGWGFQGCTVQQVVYGDGTTCSDPSVDPIVGAAVGNGPRGQGKLVDLDPEQQMVSQVFGFGVAVAPAGGGPGFSGNFRVSPFTDLWVRFPAGQPDSFFGAFYQSVLQSISWPGAGGSRFLRELSAGGNPDQLSIRFNIDGYDDDSSSPTFTTGRVVGSIGPYTPGDPLLFVAGRALQPAANSPLNTAYAEVAGAVLSLDLGNSLPTQSPGGPLADPGALSVVLLPPGGAPVVLGHVDASAANWYEQTAGIVAFKLTPAQVAQAADTPLGVLDSQGQALLEEAPDGLWLRADDFVFRLDPGTSGATTFYMTAFGRRVAGRKISLGYDATIMQGQTQQGPIPGPSPTGQPQSALTFPASITTGADGTAALTLTASDPGNPRSYVDGQVYGVSYAPGDSPPPVGSVGNSSQILSALVWSGYTAPAVPNWANDVGPILQQYADLYPVMKPIVDLSSYSDVVAKGSMIRAVLSLPVTDPNYMPVTRDLSQSKREMILAWLSNPIETARA